MIKNINKNLLSIRRQIIKRLQPVGKKVHSFISARPLITFLGLLGILFGLVVVSNVLRQPKPASEIAQMAPVKTSVYSVGGSPELVVQAQIEKTGVIRLVALSPGVVQNVHLTAGQRIARGSKVVSLSSNYQGGNIASLSRQINQKSYQAAVDNYQLQIDSITANRELAEKGETQASTLRELSRFSFDETRRIIKLNEDIFAYTEDLLEQAEASKAPESTIVTLKGQLAGQLAALSNLRSGLRTAEYLNADNEEAADLGWINRDNTLRQLELQRRAVDLSKEIAQLNLKISQVSESLMYPTAPCTGVVERVFVQVGQVVSPGTPLAVIKADESEVSAIALVSSEVARQVSVITPSTLKVDDQTFAIMPTAVATEPTDGSLHAVTYSLPGEVGNLVSQGSSVQINVPLNAGQTTLAVPIDAIYQSHNKAYVLTAEQTPAGWQAVSQEVVLGEITGSMVIISDGLSVNDQVILNRKVMAGDMVEVL